jgi:hypothetical protein
MNDYISRQAAIEALIELYEYQRDIDPTEAADLVRQGIYLAEKKIEQLPSAQPHQIVRCKDCKWGAQDEDGWWYCVEIGGRMGDGEKGDGFCSDAERRTDGKNT